MLSLLHNLISPIGSGNCLRKFKVTEDGTISDEAIKLALTWISGKLKPITAL